MPYLCDFFTNIQIHQTDTDEILNAVKLVKRLMDTGLDLARRWRSRLVVVLSVAWIELRSSPETQFYCQSLFPLLWVALE